MKNITILFVDDEPGIRKTVSLGLEDLGMKVITAESGEEALEILNTLEPDLIIADLRMQPMNGFDFFQHVKNISKLKTTPFFFLTAVDDLIAKKYSDNLSADAYITKPIDVDELYEIIVSKLSKEPKGDKQT
jgi:DNA-binding response OmpR family regulator